MSSSKPTVIKVIAVGECGIGKTSLMLSYSDPQFDPKSNPSTTGVDVINFPTTINGKPVVVQLWDTVCFFNTHIVLFFRFWFCSSSPSLLFVPLSAALSNI